jgi:hypothetical protein
MLKARCKKATELGDTLGLSKKSLDTGSLFWQNYSVSPRIDAQGPKAFPARML